MKTNNYSIGRYIELFDIDNQSEKEAFELQVRRYLEEMGAPIARWTTPGNTENASLVELDSKLYEEFGLTSQGLRLLAARQQAGTLERSKAVGGASALRSLYLQAFDCEFTQESEHLVQLRMIDPAFARFLAITSDPAARQIKAMDCSGWLRVLGGGRASLRIARYNPANEKTPSVPPIELTCSQSDLVRKIRAFWKLKRKGWRIAGYDPRPIPLIVGPSGSGKTALVRYFAASQKLPMSDFNVGTWIVSGAKSEPSTLERIAAFVDEHEEGVLFIDEVDKLFGESDWTRYVQQEVFALLDGRTESFTKWSSSIREKFASNFFIVGAGTWQDLFNERRRETGFHVSGSEMPSIDLTTQTVIPDELLMRFNADVLLLQPLRVDEFAERIVRISKEVGQEAIPPARLEMLAQRAHASRRHNRWLEAYASRLLRRFAGSGEPGPEAKV